MCKNHFVLNASEVKMANEQLSVCIVTYNNSDKIADACKHYAPVFAMRIIPVNREFKQGYNSD